MADKDKYRNRIVIDTKIHFGKPCVASTRIPIENVLELIQENIPFEEIIGKYYPDLEIEDIKACVVYATELDFISQGRTCEEARKNLEEVIIIQFQEMEEMRRLEGYLAECGFEIENDIVTPRNEIVGYERSSIHIS